MSANGTSVGLDVPPLGGGVRPGRADRGVVRGRLTPDHGNVVSWIRSLPGPVAVTYEAGPTGFGLARHLTGQGIECLVAHHRGCSARPGIGSRPMRDARHLARLLHLDQILAVAVPGVEQEAARDRVRAREDVAGI